MAKFIKTYKTEINSKQRNSLSVAFKSLAEYFLNEENADVEILVTKFDEKRIYAALITKNGIFDSKLIGLRGGIQTV